MGLSTRSQSFRSDEEANNQGPSEQRKKRIQLAIPVALHEKMLEVREVSGADTLVDVVRDALLIYLALVKEHKKGKEIIVRDDRDGKEISYALFLRN